MPYIDRNIEKKITGVYTAAQYERQEFVGDDDPALLIFFNAELTIPQVPSADQITAVLSDKYSWPDAQINELLAQANQS